MRKLKAGSLAAGVSLLGLCSASGQPVDCQAILNTLVTSPPGTFTHQQVQDMQTVYNRHCLNQQVYQPSPPQYYPSPQDDGGPFGEFMRGFMEGFLGR